MKLAESYANFWTPHSSFCILTWGHKSINHVSLVMTLVKPSSMYLARMSKKPNCCCEICFFMLKQNCFCTSENQSVSCLWTYIPVNTSLLCQVSWWFVRTDLSLPMPYSHEHFLQLTLFQWICYLLWINPWMMAFPASFNMSLHRNSWLQVFTREPLNTHSEVLFLKSHLNTKMCGAD